ncbi:MAG: type II secretion system protein GspL [Gammaproteobacteria bacterium]|nr:type II secretion system protein GspL [Gammaproteobacteria bacterium]
MTETLFLEFTESQYFVEESIESDTFPTENIAASDVTNNALAIAWFFVADNQLQHSGTIEISELSGLKQNFPGKAIVVLVPSEDCLVTSITMPTQQRRQQLKAVPFAVEEQLAENIEDVHFAIGKRDAEQKLPVVALSRKKMTFWLDVLKDAGITPSAMLPLSALLEAPKDAWSIFKLDDAFIINQNDNCWSAEAEQAALMLQLSIDEIPDDELPALLYWGSESAPGWVSGLGLEISVQLVQDELLALLARHDQNHINLLQGDFEIQDDWKAAWSVWRKVALFAFIAILLKFVSMGFELYNLNDEKQTIKSEITRVYQQVAPGARITAFPERQMRQLLARQQGGGNQSNSFLPMLGQLGESLASTPGSKPTNINYDKTRNEVRVDLLVSSLPLLDQLKDKLVSKGLSVEVGGASAQGNQYSGRLIIRSGS